MPDPLPPDLSRLGDEIVAAAERAMVARRRRVAIVARAVAGAAAALVVAAAAPGPLAPAERSGEGDPPTTFVSSQRPSPDRWPQTSGPAESREGSTAPLARPAPERTDPRGTLAGRAPTIEFAGLR